MIMIVEDRFVEESFIGRFLYNYSFVFYKMIVIVLFCLMRFYVYIVLYVGCRYVVLVGGVCFLFLFIFCYSKYFFLNLYV